MKYLEIIFHDNDFGIPIEHALKRLWEFMVKNNAHLSKVPLANLFVWLHKQG